MQKYLIDACIDATLVETMDTKDAIDIFTPVFLTV